MEHVPAMDQLLQVLQTSALVPVMVDALTCRYIDIYCITGEDHENMTQSESETELLY